MKNSLTWSHVMRLGINRQTRYTPQHFTRQWIKIRKLFYFVIQQFNSYSFFIRLCRIDIDYITSDAIICAKKINFIARILQLRQSPQKKTLIYFVTTIKMHDHAEIR